MPRVPKAVGQATIDFEEREKERGISRAGAANYRDVALAREIADELYREKKAPVSADDVREEMLKRWPDTVFGNWMGAVFRSGWVCVDFVLSRTAGRHRNAIRLWVPKEMQ